MRLHKSGEDYLETILVLERQKGAVHAVDVAKRLNVSRPSVSSAVRILKEGGFLTVEGDRTIRLTEVGREAAEAVYEKHCLLRDSLIYIGVTPETADRDACRLEHEISRETFERLKEFADRREADDVR